MPGVPFEEMFNWVEKKAIWSYGIGTCPAVKYYRCAQIVQLRRKRAKIEGMTKLRQIAFRSRVLCLDYQ